MNHQAIPKPGSEQRTDQPKTSAFSARPPVRPVQRRSDGAPQSGHNFADVAVHRPDQRPAADGQPPAPTNQTGLPDALKAGVEQLAGLSLDDVRVHYNSAKPAQFDALAFAQGRDIHLAPGQEQHLPHEAWHVVQQAQGRVQPRKQMKEGGVVNDDKGLEHESDIMGAKAAAVGHRAVSSQAAQPESGIQHGMGCGCSGCLSQPVHPENSAVPVDTGAQNSGLVMQLVACKKCGMENGHAANCPTKLQEERGMTMSRGMQIYGATMNRVPHATGGAARAGTSREATHSHGNQQAKTQAVNALVAEGVDRHKIEQPSQVRSAITDERKKAEAQQKREEKRQAQHVPKQSDSDAAKSMFEYDDHQWERLPQEERDEMVKLYREQFKNK